MSGDPHSPKATLRFSDDDLACFSAASHDRNPLHLSAEYARKTAYGRPVVFGILGALVCLGHLTARPDDELTSLVLEFLSPIFPGVAYRIEIRQQTEESASVRLYDGQRAVLRLNVCFRPGSGTRPAQDHETVAPAHTEALDRRAADLVPGSGVSGCYTPDWHQLADLIARWDLADKGLSPMQVAALLWASYLIGMELPGRRALFARLALEWEPQSEAGPLSYRAVVRTLDPRFNLLRLDVALDTPTGAPTAKGELRAFVLPEARGLLDAPFERSERLAGRVALVIGASRGLGARLAQALALQGCTVVANFQRSAAEAEQLQRQLGPEGTDAPGKVVLLQGDGGDAAWCAAARQRVLADYGRLDMLICNASPALVPLWLDPGALERIHDYVARSLALVSTPLAVFLETLSEHDGRVVVLSSAAVTSPPAAWPHYVAAKSAIEGLAAVAAREYPMVHFLVARPPRLQTDLTSTPTEYQAALPPEPVAARIAAWLASPGSAGQIEILQSFT
ncbi:MAG TPA: SDR family NAD(P)-dependent oxidoreductase [Herpetosiphonaceae bacterium]